MVFEIKMEAKRRIKGAYFRNFFRSFVLFLFWVMQILLIGMTAYFLIFDSSRTWFRVAAGITCTAVGIAALAMLKSTVQLLMEEKDGEYPEEILENSSFFRLLRRRWKGELAVFGVKLFLWAIFSCPGLLILSLIGVLSDADKLTMTILAILLLAALAVFLLGVLFYRMAAAGTLGAVRYFLIHPECKAADLLSLVRMLPVKKGLCAFSMLPLEILGLIPGAGLYCFAYCYQCKRELCRAICTQLENCREKAGEEELVKIYTGKGKQIRQITEAPL